MPFVNQRISQRVLWFRVRFHQLHCYVNSAKVDGVKSPRVGQILKAPKVDPDCVTANVLAAMIHILIGSTKSRNEAGILLSRASHLPAASDYEKSWISAASSWYQVSLDKRKNLIGDIRKKLIFS
jgi:hypothetical protein